MAGVNVTIGADSSKAQRELTSFEKKTKRVAGHIAKGFQERIGVKLLEGFTSAAAKVPQVLSGAVNSASDLREEINKSQAVFGDASKGIIEWSKGTAKALGISRVAALEATGTMGNMLLAFGVGQKQAAGMSKELVTLAADMASFNNATVEDTIFAIGAAMRGETEPIRKYGVSLNDANLKQEALSMGLYNGKGALGANAKALAAYNAILNQTKIQQGDSAKTANELAGSKRRLQAQFEDLKTEIGAALLPAFGELIKALSSIPFDEVGQKISHVLKLITKLAPAIIAVGTALAGVKLIQYFNGVAASLTRTIALWSAETVAIKKNTDAKIANMVAGMQKRGKGASFLTGSGLALLSKKAAAILTTAGLGFGLGKMMGDPIADMLVPDETGVLSGPTNEPPTTGGAGVSRATESAKEEKRVAEELNEEYSYAKQLIDAKVAGNEKFVTYLENGLEIQKIQNEFAKDGVQLERDKAVAIWEQREAYKELQKAKEKEKAQSKITEEYKETLRLLEARISGDAQLLEQEEIRRDVLAEQNRFAQGGEVLDKTRATEIVMKRREAEAAEKRRADEKDAIKGIRKQELVDLKKKESETEKAFESAMSRSSIQAVSSMQAIGGGGGVSGELNLQKTQTDLLRELVTLQAQVVEKTQDLSKGPVGQ